MVAGRQGGVQIRSDGGRGGGRGAGEARGERGRREICASAPAWPRGIRGRVRITPRVMGRELAHVCGMTRQS